MNFTIATPREVAMAMLALRFGPRPDRAADAGLPAFQREAVDRLSRIIDRRGGAFLCDSVGLGKTHVAAALAHRARRDSYPVLISGPAQLAVQWRRSMRGITGWRWLSHAALSRGAGEPTLTGGLIIVDEAHAVRNPATRRYRNLALLCADAKVLLVTATPVNNSVLDFYHLIRLFAADDAFADIGVPGLRCTVTTAAHGRDTNGLRRVIEAVVVRRTRRVVQRLYRQEAPGDDGLRLTFPRQRPVRPMHYDLRAVYPELERAVGEILPRLTFPAHVLGRSGGDGVAELMRITLLKRLESSSAAFAGSVERHRRLIAAFLRAAENGFLVDAREYARGSNDATGSEQLALDAVLHRPWPASLDLRRAVDLAGEEARMLDELRSSVAGGGQDPKVAAVIDLLKREFEGERVVIFTEFRDTARLLWQGIVPFGGAGIIHGSDARLASGPAPRHAVIARFAPVSNHARPPAPHEAVTRLIATDVLAEGLNLQDARVVISFDLPWNPVRLAQRVGRIDRLGSIHREIEVLAFMPDQGLEVVLRLLHRIRRKLHDIRVVGGDRPRLGTRPGMASRPASGSRAADRDLEQTELLRARYTEVADDSDVSPVAGPAAAAMSWDDEAPAVLCCVASADTAWLVLVQTNGPPVVHSAEADTALLAALDGAPALRPDLGRIRNAARKAASAAMRSAAPPWPPRESHAIGRAARAVHSWLATRPSGPDWDESARADAILNALARGTTAALGRPRRPCDTAGPGRGCGRAGSRYPPTTTAAGPAKCRSEAPFPTSGVRCTRARAPPPGGSAAR
jgi:hypothetical protein